MRQTKLISQRVWLLVALFAFGVRGGYLIVHRASLERDPDSYRRLAENLRQTGVMGWRGSSASGEQVVRPTAFRPPLYPLLLALLAPSGRLDWLAIGVLHLLCGLATVFVVARSGLWLNLGKFSVVACLAVTLDPLLLNQSAEVMTETLATLVATTAIYCLMRAADRPSFWLDVSAGLSLGFCILCRPSFLPWVGLVGLVGATTVARLDPSATRVARVRGICCWLFVALLVVAPWGWRNDLVMGSAKFTTTHGGYTLLLGNNPLFYQHLRESDGLWDSAPLVSAWDLREKTSGPQDPLWSDPTRLPDATKDRAEPARMDEFASDRFAYLLAWRYIQEDPIAFAHACVVRVLRLWRLTSHPPGGLEGPLHRMARWGVGVWYACIFGLAISAAFRLGTRLFQDPWVWGLLLCCVLTGVHAFFWSNLRMRAPVTPFLMLLASWRLAGFWRSARDV